MFWKNIARSVVTVKMSHKILILLSMLFLLIACDKGPSHNTQKSDGNALANQQAMAAAQGSEGEKLFNTRCAICHAVDVNKTSVIGPHLAGVSGRPAGTLEAFAYSSAMKTYALNWNDENLNSFLKNPALLVPGNRMAFAGLGKAEQRQHIIEYLNFFK
jgi:cytochrome c